MPADQQATVEVPREAIEDTARTLYRLGQGDLARDLEALLPPPPDPWEGLAEAMTKAWYPTHRDGGDIADCYHAELRAALDWLRSNPEAGLPGGLEFDHTAKASGRHHFRLLVKDGDR